MNPIILATVGDAIDKAFYGFDTWVYTLFGAIQNGFFTAVAKIFTSFGDEAFVIPMAIFGIVLCFFKKTRKYGFALIFAIAIGTIVTNVVVKPAVLRIRPYNTLQMTPFWSRYEAWYKAAGALSESDYSFPSGHTTAAFEMAVATALCLRSDGKKKLSFIPPVIALCVMGSRVYLMVHYATDVIGGCLVGTCAGVIAFFLSKLVVTKLFEGKKLDKIDVERLFKNGINPKLATCAILTVICALFLVSYVPSLKEGGNYEQTCAYNHENFADAKYDCYNAARVDDDEYVAFDGDGDGDLDEYCKIHWNLLHSAENAE